MTKSYMFPPCRILTFGSCVLAVFIALCGVVNFARADLVTYWTFNENTFSDASGNGFTGTLAGTNPTIVDNGKYGKAFQGNANGKFNINVSAANVNVNNFTISFWGKQPTSANWKDYLSVYSSVYGDLDFQRANNSISIYNNPWGTIFGDTDVSSGFHHIAFTADASTGDAKLYVDGALKASVNKSDVNSVINAITLGGNYMSAARNGNAGIDEFQLYNQALTAEQVSHLYNNPSLYQATVYQRDVSANGNWSDAAWTANGQTNQPFANSSAVELTATNSPTLTLDQNVTVNSIDFTGSMTVSGSNTITLNGEKRIGVASGATATITAPVTALYDGAITKDGAGTLSLTAANTYTGGTTVTGGTLAFSNVNGLGTGPVTINGATLNASAAGNNKTFANAIIVGEEGATVTVATGNYSSFSSISGSGDLTTNGFLHFNGTGGYNGHLTVNSGYTRVIPGAMGVIDLTINGKNHFNVLESGTVQIGKLNATEDAELFVSQQANQVTLDIGVGTTSSDTATYSGNFRGTSNGAYNLTIKKSGEGTQIFNRTGYGYAGTPNSIKEVIVDGGKMVIDASHKVYTADNVDGFWGSAPITINEGGTLQYVHSWTSSPNIKLTINGGTLTLDNAQYLNKLVFDSGTVNGSGKLRAGYKGTGVWEVKGGTSTINNPLELVKNGNNTTFTVNFAEGATLDIKGAFIGLANYTGTNVFFTGTGDGPGNVSFNSSAGVATGLGTVTFTNMNASIAGGSGWMDNGYFGGSAVTVKDSTLTTSREHSLNNTNITLDHGTLTANGEVNTYIYNLYLKNGSTVNGTTDGSQFRTGHQWNSNIYTQYDEGTPENVMNTISVDIAMYDTSKTITIDVADKAPLTISSSFVPAGNNHSNALVKTGDGTLIFSGANTYTSSTTISAGVLQLTGDAIVANSPITVGNNGTLEYNVSDGTKLLTFNSSNTISGAGKIVKTGDGTLKIYTASAGQVGVTSFVVSSGRLDMKEYFKGALIVGEELDEGEYTAATFSPGNSIGTLNIDGSFELNPGSTLLIEQDSTGMDKLIASSFDFDDNSIIQLDMTSIAPGATYDIIVQSEGLFTEQQLEASFWTSLIDGGLPYYLNLLVINNNTVRLHIDANAVPEPSTWALLALGAAGLMYWRKNAQKRA